MKPNHERIYLVPTDYEGGQLTYTWCDHPAPGEGMDPDDAVKYVRADLVGNDVLAKRVAELDRKCSEQAKVIEHIARAVGCEDDPMSCWESVDSIIAQRDALIKVAENTLNENAGKFLSLMTARTEADQYKSDYLELQRQHDELQTMLFNERKKAARIKLTLLRGRIMQDENGHEIWCLDPAEVDKAVEFIPAQHPDDQAVDRFADAMKTKLAAAREKGRSGWDDKEKCTGEYLANMLVAHLSKANQGTFEDIANFAMMLHQRGESPKLLKAGITEVRAKAVEDAVAYVVNKDYYECLLWSRYVSESKLLEYANQIRQQAKGE